MSLIYAFTAPSSNYPPYINLSAGDAPGTARVIVRSEGNGGNDTASMVLEHLQLAEMALAILKYLKADTPLRATIDARVQALLGNGAAIDAQVKPVASPFAGDDFPLGQACDLSGDGTCEACQ